MTGAKADLLTFDRYRPGFLWGEAVWGQSVWGVDAPAGPLDSDFTSLTINKPGSVEDGLFVRTEAESAQLTTTVAADLDLKGERISISYDGDQLFYGTVSRVSMGETVDVTGSHKRGNTAVRTHRVTLRLEKGTEYFATAPTPPRSFTNQNLATRLKSLIGTTTIGANVSSHTDVDSGVMENVGPWITDREKVLTTDQRGSLLDTILNMLGRLNKVLRPFLGAGYVEADSISQVVTGTTIAGTLRFTDSELYTVPAMSYSERDVSDDPAMFTTGVAVTIAGVRYGPYDTSGSQRVAEVDLGDMDFAGRDPQVARNFAATVPLKRVPGTFTSRITAPAQPDRFTPSIPTPRLAVLRRAGVETQVALIGVTHTISPRMDRPNELRWVMDFECAPPHLMTRHSDLDPSPATSIQVDQPGGAGTAVRVRFNAPKNLPTDVPLYRSVFWQTLAVAGGELSTDAGHNIVDHTLATGTVPGAAQTVTFASPGVGLKFFYVQYTSDPAPASGVFSDTYRQGQPRWVSYTVT